MALCRTAVDLRYVRYNVVTRAIITILGIIAGGRGTAEGSAVSGGTCGVTIPVLVIFLGTGSGAGGIRGNLRTRTAGGVGFLFITTAIVVVVRVA